MEITIEKEFEQVKRSLLFNKVFEKIIDYNKTLEEVDLPDFCKPIEEQPINQAIGFVERIIEENRVNESLLNYMELNDELLQ